MKGSKKAEGESNRKITFPIKSEGNTFDRETIISVTFARAVHIDDLLKMIRIWCKHDSISEY